MKKPGPNVIVPLNDEEKNFLLAIYKKRRRFLGIVYIIMFAVAVFICAFAYGMDTLRNMQVPADHIKYESTLGMRTINLVFICIILLASGVYLYFKKVLAFKRDADSGEKEKVTYTIVKKEYFPNTDQYYVAFNDPNYLHHETDRDTWNACYEGGDYYIYRAIRSKFVFEENGKWSII